MYTPPDMNHISYITCLFKNYSLLGPEIVYSGTNVPLLVTKSDAFPFSTAENSIIRIEAVGLYETS